MPSKAGAEKKNKRPGTWDRGVEYKKMWEELMEDLKYLSLKKKVHDLEKPNQDTPRKLSSRLAYVSVLLIQLRNGSRISEGVEAALKFAENGQREQFVKVRKTKRGTTRFMVIPGEVKKDYLSGLIGRGRDEKHITNSIEGFVREHYGVNTHSLRYAFVSEGAKRGLPAQTIASITKHQTLDMILKYTQEKEGEKVLKGWNKNGK